MDLETNGKKYNIIYADPPWDVLAGPPWSSNQKSQPLDYPTMSIDEIKNMPVKEISADDSHLYLWLINKYIKEGYEIAEEWGFKPSCLLTWCKPKHGLGLGGAYIQTTEFLLFCRRGSLPHKKRVDTSWFENKRLSHSTKPSMFRTMIIEVSGDLPRIELFARQQWDGWDCYGNQLSDTIQKLLDIKQQVKEK